MILGAILLGLGLAEIWWMIWAIRRKAWNDHLSVLEIGLLKATGEQPEPLPRGWGMLQCWLGLFLGVFLTVIGAAAIYAS